MELVCSFWEKKRSNTLNSVLQQSILQGCRKAGYRRKQYRHYTDAVKMVNKPFSATFEVLTAALTVIQLLA
jgi:hypothetical protein